MPPPLSGAEEALARSFSSCCGQRQARPPSKRGAARRTWAAFLPHPESFSPCNTNIMKSFWYLTGLNSAETLLQRRKKYVLTLQIKCSLTYFRFYNIILTFDFWNQNVLKNFYRLFIFAQKQKVGWVKNKHSHAVQSSSLKTNNF